MDTTSVAYVLCAGSRMIHPLPPSVSMRTSLMAWQPVSIRSRWRTSTSATVWGAPIPPDQRRSQLLLKKAVDLRLREGEVFHAGKEL
jgi:hypothetical protein